MLTETTVIDVLKDTCTGILIIAGSYYLIKRDLLRYIYKPNSGQKPQDAQLLSLRLQAHERLVLLVERINPANLLVQLHVGGISKEQLQEMLLAQVNAEYQHNVTQQLYVAPEVWLVITKLMQDTLLLINNTARTIPEGSDGLTLSRKILENLSGIDENPYAAAQRLINAECSKNAL